MADLGIERQFGLGAVWYDLVAGYDDMEGYPLEAKEYVGQLHIHCLLAMKPDVADVLASAVVGQIATHFPQVCTKGFLQSLAAEGTTTEAL